MTGPDLSPGDFATFFAAVHGTPPFPWQDRLLHRLAESGIWPEVLDLPTGCGKTATLDIAVFHLALEASRGPHRRAPTRIAFVVDRRLIVDDAFARARKLQAALAAPKSEIVQRVAAALRSRSGEGEPPLLARRLRGGMPREDDWARTPSQPTILCSTVDQVGSRLLFRGYGISDRMKPVHAGLLGSDCLILLDEAHLSRPFRQTLHAIAWYREHRHEPEWASPSPFQVALLTATPGEDTDERFPREPENEHFSLEQEDHEHPVLRNRLEAVKPAFLLDIKGRQGQAIEDQRTEAVAEAVAEALRRLEQQRLDTQPVIGVVVNRVLRARRIFQRLREAYGPDQNGAPAQADVLLVIGPAREVVRQERVAELAPIKTAAAARARLPRPMIVVATQTIEAGADLDFDALIAEIAPLDALKQRFGRLNRAGRRLLPYAAILAHREDMRPGKDGDAVYGQAAASTWAALQKLAQGRGNGATVDFSSTASDAAPWIGEISPKQMKDEDLLAGKPDAPVLMPAYVDLWSHTSPRPAADPEVSLFLHGPDRSAPSVQIVWRADLDEAVLMQARTDADARRRMLELLGAMPPKPGETVEVSLAAARRWLQSMRHERSDANLDFSDVPERGREEEPELEQGRPAFRWAGPESERSESIRAHKLWPNDLIIVPADYGGCDEFGWDPDFLEPVRDVANEATAPFSGQRFALRLTPTLIRAAAPSGGDEDAAAERDKASAFADGLCEVITDWRDASGRRRARDLLGALMDAIPPAPTAEKLKSLKSARRRLLQAIFPYGEDPEGRPRGVVLLAPKGVQVEGLEELVGGVAATEDDQQGSLSGEAQTLADHSRQVEEFANCFATRAGLDERSASDLALAAYLHDAGKADERYQAMLYGGNRFAVNESNVLAKSLPGVGPDAWDRAGLPRPWRHEALSVRIAREHARFAAAHDPELVLWLIGVHHGYGRPLFPHADEDPPTELPDVLGGLRAAAGPGPQSLAFDFKGRDWAQIFERLKRRYGAWELARMEAIVRLADHRASEAAPRRGGEDAT